MPIETLLFHTRFRDQAFKALQSALELKHAGLKRVVLVHVIPREDVAFVPYGGMLTEDLERIREEVRIKFDDWIQTLDDPELVFRQRVEVGSINAELLDIAKEERADLIVCGRKKRSSLEKVYVGTHILDILRRSEIPVLMGKFEVPYERNGESLKRINTDFWERPLLATDWSEPSSRALDATVNLKGIVEKIIVTHVLGSRQTKNLEAEAIRKLENVSLERLETYSQRVKEAGIEVEHHLAMGRTVEELIKMSRDFGATMIVMGRTGKDWFHQYWLGGVSHQVAELSELPVLLIP